MDTTYFEIANPNPLISFQYIVIIVSMWHSFLFINYNNKNRHHGSGAKK